jgi:hypothetical protein
MRPTNSMEDYFAALERLKANNPQRVPKYTRITNDAVALEAGRGKGSIKKSRPLHASLIAAIHLASQDMEQLELGENVRLEQEKSKARQLRDELDSALGREISLLNELFEVRKQLALLTGTKVIPIRRHEKEDAKT